MVSKTVAPASPPSSKLKGRTLLSPDDVIDDMKSSDITPSNDITHSNDSTPSKETQNDSYNIFDTATTERDTASKASENNQKISVSKLEQVLRDFKVMQQSSQVTKDATATSPLELTTTSANKEEISAIQLQQALKKLRLSQSSLKESDNDEGQIVKPLPNPTVQQPAPVSNLQFFVNNSQVPTNNLPAVNQLLPLTLQQLATLNLPLTATTQPLPVMLPEPNKPLALTNQPLQQNNQVLQVDNSGQVDPVNWYVGYGPSPLSKGAEAAAVILKSKTTP